MVTDRPAQLAQARALGSLTAAFLETNGHGLRDATTLPGRPCDISEQAGNVIAWLWLDDSPGWMSGFAADMWTDVRDRGVSLEQFVDGVMNALPTEFPADEKPRLRDRLLTTTEETIGGMYVVF